MSSNIHVARQFLGVRFGRIYLSVRGPCYRAYFSERNRIGCFVLSLPHGWRIVMRRNPRLA